MSGRAGRLVVDRLVLGVMTLFVVSLVVFTLTVVLPGAPLRAGAPELLPLRYVHWASGLLAGNVGDVDAAGGLSSARVSASLGLLLATACVALPLGLALGVLSTVRRGSSRDGALDSAVLAVVAAPELLIAALVALGLSAQLGEGGSLPLAVASPDIAPPFLTLCVIVAAQMARLTRAVLRDLLGTAHAEMAMLKGIRPDRIVLAHALPNAASALGKAASVALASLLSGAVVVETVFGYPGAGRAMVEAAVDGDLAVVPACAMLFAAVYLVLALLAELAVLLVVPRLRRR